MKLQKHRHAKYKGKDYHKYEIVLPRDLVERLGWREGEDLTAEVRGRTLMLKPVAKPNGC